MLRLLCAFLLLLVASRASSRSCVPVVVETLYGAFPSENSWTIKDATHNILCKSSAVSGPTYASRCAWVQVTVNNVSLGLYNEYDEAILEANLLQYFWCLLYKTTCCIPENDVYTLNLVDKYGDGWNVPFGTTREVESLSRGQSVGGSAMVKDINGKLLVSVTSNDTTLSKSSFAVRKAATYASNCSISEYLQATLPQQTISGSSFTEASLSWFGVLRESGCGWVVSAAYDGIEANSTTQNLYSSLTISLYATPFPGLAFFVYDGIVDVTANDTSAALVNITSTTTITVKTSTSFATIGVRIYDADAAKNYTSSKVYFTAIIRGNSCPSNCSAHGKCVFAVCECDFGWQGAKCDVPSTWLSESDFYSDGVCDCTSGIPDPDCSVSSHEQECKSFEIMGPFEYSADRSALPSGVCLFCPIPDSTVAPESSVYANNTLLRVNGQTLLRCPYTLTCSNGTTCDLNTGLCYGDSSTSSRKKLCVIMNECDTFQICGSEGYCQNIDANLSALSLYPDPVVPSSGGACAGNYLYTTIQGSISCSGSGVVSYAHASVSPQLTIPFLSTTRFSYKVKAFGVPRKSVMQLQYGDVIIDLMQPCTKVSVSLYYHNISTEVNSSIISASPWRLINSTGTVIVSSVFHRAGSKFTDKISVCLPPDSYVFDGSLVANWWGTCTQCGMVRIATLETTTMLNFQHEETANFLIPVDFEYSPLQTAKSPELIVTYESVVDNSTLGFFEFEWQFEVDQSNISCTTNASAYELSTNSTTLRYCKDSYTNITFTQHCDGIHASISASAISFNAFKFYGVNNSIDVSSINSELGGAAAQFVSASLMMVDLPVYPRTLGVWIFFELSSNATGSTFLLQDGLVEVGFNNLLYPFVSILGHTFTSTTNISVATWTHVAFAFGPEYYPPAILIDGLKYAVNFNTSLLENFGPPLQVSATTITFLMDTTTGLNEECVKSGIVEFQKTLLGNRFHNFNVTASIKLHYKPLGDVDRWMIHFTTSDLFAASTLQVFLNKFDEDLLLQEAPNVLMSASLSATCGLSAGAQLSGVISASVDDSEHWTTIFKPNSSFRVLDNIASGTDSVSLDRLQLWSRSIPFNELSQLFGFVSCRLEDTTLLACFEFDDVTSTTPQDHGPLHRDAYAYELGLTKGRIASALQHLFLISGNTINIDVSLTEGTEALLSIACVQCPSVYGVVCNGHGSCDRGFCICNAGWGGTDCTYTLGCSGEYIMSDIESLRSALIIGIDYRPEYVLLVPGVNFTANASSVQVNCTLYTSSSCGKFLLFGDGMSISTQSSLVAANGIQYPEALDGSLFGLNASSAAELIRTQLGKTFETFVFEEVNEFDATVYAAKTPWAVIGCAPVTIGFKISSNISELEWEITRASSNKSLYSEHLSQLKDGALYQGLLLTRTVCLPAGQYQWVLTYPTVNPNITVQLQYFDSSDSMQNWKKSQLDSPWTQISGSSSFSSYIRFDITLISCDSKVIDISEYSVFSFVEDSGAQGWSVTASGSTSLVPTSSSQSRWTPPATSITPVSSGRIAYITNDRFQVHVIEAGYSMYPQTLITQAYENIIWVAPNSFSNYFFNGSSAEYGSQSAPYLSMRKALKEVSANDIIILLPGRYYGMDNCDLQISKPIFIVALSPTSRYTVFDCEGYSRWMTINSIERVFIEDFTVVNTNLHCDTTVCESGTILTVLGGLISLTNMVFEGNSGASLIDVQGPAGIQIQDCVFTNNTLLARQTSVDGCLISLKNTRDSYIVNSLFEYNICEALQGGSVNGIYASINFSLTKGNVAIQNTTFTENILYNGEGLVQVEGSGAAISITDTLFINNDAIGIVSQDGAVLTVSNTDIMSSTSAAFKVSGGSLQITNVNITAGGSQDTFIVENFAELYLSNSSVHAESSAGILNILTASAIISNVIIEGGSSRMLSATDSNVTVTSLDISNRTADVGAAFFLTNSRSNISDCHFSYLNASEGGAVFVTRGSLYLKNAYFTNMTAITGGAIYADGADMTVDNCRFDDVYASTQGGAIFVGAKSTVIIENSTFVHVKSGLNGGALATDSSTLRFINSTVLNCSSSSGGCFSASTSEVTLASSTLMTCTATLQGGCIFSSSGKLNVFQSVITNGSSKDGGCINVISSGVSMFNSSVHSCFARRGGAVYAVSIDQGYPFMTDCEIRHNIATIGGSHVYLSVSDNTNVEFRSTNFTDGSTGTGGAFQLMQSSTRLINCFLYNNKATTYGGAIYSVHSDFSIEESVLEGHSALLSGGCAYMFMSYAWVSSTHILNTSATFTGGGWQMESSWLRMNNSWVTYSTSASGGFAYLTDATLLSVNNSIQYSTAQYGAGVNLQSLCTFVSMQDAWLNNSASFGGVIYADSSDSIQVILSDFTTNNAMALSVNYGGALYLTNIGKVVISSSNFISNGQSATVGGGIFLQNSDAVVSNCIFERNRGSKGSAAYFMNLLGGQTFRENSVINNTAYVAGGGVYWTTKEPLLINTSTFSGNTAVYYGPNLASAPLDINVTYTGGLIGSGIKLQGLWVDLKDYYEQRTRDVNTGTVVATGNDTKSAISGTTTEVFKRGRAIFDNLIVTTIPGTNATLLFKSSSASRKSFARLVVDVRKCKKGEQKPAEGVVGQCKTCPYQTFAADPDGSYTCNNCPSGAVCYGGDLVYAIDGYWRFNGTYGLCTGNSETGEGTCSLIQCQASDACEGHKQIGMQILGFDTNLFAFSVSKTGGVVQGDLIYTNGNPYRVTKVELISKNNYYVYVSSDSNSTFSSTTSNVDVYLQQPETCYPGYFGNACFQCQAKYQRVNQNNCVQCPSNLVISYIVLIAGIIGVALILGFIITLRGGSYEKCEEEERLSTMIKIVLSYLQFVSIFSSLSLQWPAIIVRMFETQQLVSTVGQRLIALDCVFNRGPTTADLFYWKCLFFISLPILSGWLPFLYWKRRWLLKERKHSAQPWDWGNPSVASVAEDGLISADEVKMVLEVFGEDSSDGYVSEIIGKLRLHQKPAPVEQFETAYFNAVKMVFGDKAMLSTVVLVFLVHPTVCTWTFLLFNCEELEKGKWFLTAALNTQCYTHQHWLWMALLGIPSAVFLVMGIPAVALFALYKHRENLQDPHVFMRWGFLYDGYEEKYYFWEIWVMYRKVLLVFVSVVLNNVGILVQVMGALAVALIALTAQFLAQPYADPLLDRLENYSMMAAVGTIYFGLFFFNPNSSSGARVFVIFAIFLLNALFVGTACYLCYGDVKKKLVEMRKLAREMSGRIKTAIELRSIKPLFEKGEEAASEGKEEDMEHGKHGTPTLVVGVVNDVPAQADAKPLTPRSHPSESSKPSLTSPGPERHVGVHDIDQAPKSKHV